MRSFLAGFGRVLKYLLLFHFILFFFALGAVVFCEQKIPSSLLRYATDKLSTGGFVVHVGSASFHFIHGVTLRDVRVLDATRPHAAPVIAARRVALELNLTRLPWAWERLLRRVTIDRLVYPRLPEGYYIPDSIEFPGQPDFQEKDEPLVFQMARIHPFSVRLENPDILGVTPKFVDIKNVEFTQETMTARGLHLQWRDADVPMALDGGMELDVGRQLVRGRVDGQARPQNIVPMLQTIDITNAIPFIEDFTYIEQPVDATCAFNVNLRNNDLNIYLKLHPRGGRYNNVPLKGVAGELDIRVFVRDTFQNADIKIGPLDAQLADGTSMDGTVYYRNTNDIGYVDFDVRSATSLSNALAVADVMNDGTLDCLVPETTPRLSLNGRLAVNPAHARLNDLHGTVAFEKGTFFGIPLRNAAAAFHLKDTDITFADARAEGPHGGTLTGSARLSIPDFKQDHATYSVSITGGDLPLKDIADVFAFDVGDRHGRVAGTVTLAGPLRSDSLDRLNGHGHVVCADGYLAQLKIFSGLTATLAKHVPGLPLVVNQSQASLDFTISNGVFRTSNILIDGKVFSIHASGSYDLPRDHLDLKANVSFTKPDEWYTQITMPISWSVAHLSKLLFEFRIEGPLENPSTTYNKQKFTDWLKMKK